MAEAAAHAGTQSIVATLLSYWWLALIFGGAVLDWIAERFDVGLRALRRRAQRRHEHRLELRRLELEIAQAKTGAAVVTAPAPGLCRHRQAVPVRDSEGTVLAWLCRSCDTQLPPEFSVFAEDL